MVLEDEHSIWTFYLRITVPHPSWIVEAFQLFRVISQNNQTYHLVKAKNEWSEKNT